MIFVLADTRSESLICNIHCIIFRINESLFLLFLHSCLFTFPWLLFVLFLYIFVSCFLHDWGTSNSQRHFVYEKMVDSVFLMKTRNLGWNPSNSLFSSESFNLCFLMSEQILSFPSGCAWACNTAFAKSSFEFAFLFFSTVSVDWN